MFVRISKTPNSPRVCIKLVENIREGCKVRQRIIQHIGIANDEKEIEKLKCLGAEIILKKSLKENKQQDNKV